MLKQLIKSHPSKVDFLIPGVQKGGTSALHAYLALHPQLVPPERTKELQFFVGSGKSISWYHRQFPKRRYRDKLCFESTPDYICGYHFVADMAGYKARYSPKMKLILIFRDPVSRAYSQWNMTRHFMAAVNNPGGEEARVLKKYNPRAFDLYTSMDELPSFNRCFELFLEFFEKLTPVDDLRQLNQGGRINEIPGQFFVRGLYLFQLKALLDLFPSGDLLILESDELKSDTSAVLDKVARFLGVAEFKWPQSEIRVPRHVSSYRRPMGIDAENRIGSFYAPYNEAFFALAGKTYAWR